MSTLASVIIRDVFASRPSASIAGRLFFASDTGAMYRDSGSVWEVVTAGPGSAVFASHQATATGTITIDADETLELANNSTSPVATITRTLPLAASCTDAIVTVKKVDSGTGVVRVQSGGSPAEAIDTIYTYWDLTNQNQYVRLFSDGTGWNVIGNN
jgi:hypothetical protein